MGFNIPMSVVKPASTGSGPYNRSASDWLSVGGHLALKQSIQMHKNYYGRLNPTSISSFSYKSTFVELSSPSNSLFRFPEIIQDRILEMVSFEKEGA